MSSVPPAGLEVILMHNADLACERGAVAEAEPVIAFPELDALVDDDLRLADHAHVARIRSIPLPAAPEPLTEDSP